MKNFCMSIGLLSMASGFLHAQSESNIETAFQVVLRNEDNQPVSGADVAFGFAHISDLNQDYSIHKITNAEGFAEASAKVGGYVNIDVKKDNYYSIHDERVVIRGDVDVNKIKLATRSLIMRRIKSPASLYGKTVKTWIPKQNVSIGFDFQMGDWVKPYGAGVLSDILISYNKTFAGYKYPDDQLAEERAFLKDYAESAHQPWSEEIFKEKVGKWDVKLMISFIEKKSGIIIVDKDYCDYSGLKMPHLSYGDGYRPSLSFEKNNYSPEENKINNGFFVMTRVVENAQGDIVSANYAKITSKIDFDPKGGITFCYVFNPTANDRNLEFDWRNNLFKKIKIGEVRCNGFLDQNLFN